MSRIYGQKLYYSDKRNDDFMDTDARLTRPIDAKYRYESRNPVFRLFSFILYWFIALPVFWILCKLVYGIKVVGRKNLKKIKGGCVFYSNHVCVLDCAFALVFASFPRRGWIVCNADAVHIPFVRLFVRMLGGVPLPDNMAAFKNMNKAVDKRLQKGQALIVMPEAHIWPYYTGIREFPSTSFGFAARNNVPAVPVAVTYVKPKGLFKRFKKPRVVYRIGEPVYPDSSKSVKTNSVEMCKATYERMVEMSEYSEVDYYDYVKTDEKVETHTQIAKLKQAQKMRVKARRHLNAFGKKVFRNDFAHRVENSFEAPVDDDLEYAYQYTWDYYNRK